jgi:Flp pilus assembly pilin Flp
MALSCHRRPLPGHWALCGQSLCFSKKGTWPGVFLFVAESRTRPVSQRRFTVANLLRKFWQDERGQDIAEYAVMLAVILVIVIGTVRLIGTNANNVFSQVGSAIGQ